jgi:hypothetical protein
MTRTDPYSTYRLPRSPRDRKQQNGASAETTMPIYNIEEITTLNRSGRDDVDHATEPSQPVVTDIGRIAAVQNDESDNDAVVHRMEEGRLRRAPVLLIDRRLDSWARRCPDVHV